MVKTVFSSRNKSPNWTFSLSKLHIILTKFYAEVKTANERLRAGKFSFQIRNVISSIVGNDVYTILTAPAKNPVSSLALVTITYNCVFNIVNHIRPTRNSQLPKITTPNIYLRLWFRLITFNCFTAANQQMHSDCHPTVI